MGKIEIDIPTDIEAQLDARFPSEDRPAAVMRLIREGLGPVDGDPVEMERRSRFAAALASLDKLRSAGPAYTDDDIRIARQVGRP